ncbi:hypothetical protein BGW37DRAFT_495754, partial [Umbelopsis sp. PMI_123]
MASQPQAQLGRFKRLLGSSSGGKNRLSLNTSNSYLSEFIAKSPDEGRRNRRQSLQLFSVISSPVSSKSSTRSASETDSELGFISKPYESTAAGESPSLTLDGVLPSPQRNLPARPQTSMSFRKHSSPSLHQFHSSSSELSLEVTQSPTTIEPLNTIPEHGTIISPSKASSKSDGDRQYASLDLTSSHRIDSSKRSLSSNNLRSSDAPVSSTHESSNTERSSTLFGARKRISSLLPDSWQSDAIRSRRLTMSSLSHSSDNETSGSESPPATPAQPGAQFIQENDNEANVFQLPLHKPVSPITQDLSSFLKNEPGEYFSEKPSSPYASLVDQNGNWPTTDKPVVHPPRPMPFLAGAQSTRSRKSQDEEWSYSKPDNRYLAEQVRLVLGSAMTEADLEIEEEWEIHREALRQTSSSSTYSRAVGGL